MMKRKFEDEEDMYMDENIFLIMTDDFVAFFWNRSVLCAGKSYSKRLMMILYLEYCRPLVASHY